MNAQDIKQSLATRDSKSLLRGLSSLRATFSIKSSEIVSPDDARLALAKSWLAISPAAQDLFDIWAAAKTLADGDRLVPLVLFTLSSLISLLSCHLPYHPHGISVIKSILSPQWLQRVNSCLLGTQHDQILAAINLFHTMSMFGSGRERKSVFDAFPWDHKTLPKLLHMRRRGKGRGEIFHHQPDIRTCYTLLILSMFNQDSSPAIKAAFLTQYHDAVTSLVKGLSEDHITLVRRVLEVFWENIWLDPRIRRTTKVAIFNEVTISHLLKLYERTAVEEPGNDDLVADITHHFLLAICTRPGHGVCFPDRGWYPRPTNETGDSQEAAGDVTEKDVRIYNKILANVLRALRINEDARQRELALRIISACPELVPRYWSMAALAVEPRLSSKWIATIMFARQVISQEIPVSSFLLPGSNSLYNPTPPPLSMIMANVLPPSDSKTLFSKGLQATSTPLVQYCTALALAQCLQKLIKVMRIFEMIGAALQEDEEGQWSCQQKKVEKETRHRLPDFQVIMAFQQQASASQPNPTKDALLNEVSQRLLWLYQESLPDVVTDAKFEIGKLAINLSQGLSTSFSCDNSIRSVGHGDQDSTLVALQSVKQLHVLRLLRRSDRFVWTGKAAPSSHSYLHVLLNTLCNTRVCALRTTLKDLLQHILADSVLFQDDPTEVEIWLASLPSGSSCQRQAPDGALLTNEVDAIVTFLDDCVRQCLNTPHRYIEAMSNLTYSGPPTITTDTRYHETAFASPLLMTLVEQFMVKMGRKLMTPSDALTICMFMRRLLVLLASKQEDIDYSGLHAMLDQLDKCTAELPFPDHPSICFGIRRELSIAAACLCHPLSSGVTSHRSQNTSNEVATNFLKHPERQLASGSEATCMVRAFELVDQVRFVDVNLSSSDISQVASIVHQLHEPALWALVHHLHPSEGHLWDSNIMKLISDQSSAEHTFVWLYLLSTHRHLQEEKIRDVLLDILYSHPLNYADLERSARLIVHGIGKSLGHDALTSALLALLSGVLARASEKLSENDTKQLKARVVIQTTSMQRLSTSESLECDVYEAIQKLIEISFDHTDGTDQALLSPISSHWLEKILHALSSGQLDLLRYARPWIKFMRTDQLITIVDLLQPKVNHQSGSTANHMAESVSGIDCPTADILDTVLSVLNQRGLQLPVSKLLLLQGVFSSISLLDDMLSAALVMQLPPGFKGAVGFSDQPTLSTILSDTIHSPPVVNELPPGFITRLLERGTWSDSIGESIVVLLYADTTSLKTYASWIKGRGWLRHSPALFAATLSAFLDCTQLSGGSLNHFGDDMLSNLLHRLFANVSHSGDNCLQHLESICRILELEGDRRPQLAATLLEDIERTPTTDLASETCFIARKVLGLPSCHVLVSSIVDRVLQWAVRHVSTGATDSDDSRGVIQNLEHIAKSTEFRLKSHLVEPLLTAIAQNRLREVTTLDLAIVLVENTSLKPIVINRLLQAILQHLHFTSICGKDEAPFAKNRVASLLRSLFQINPETTCQLLHIKPLLQVYGGTLSRFDRDLLSIMRLFEATKQTSLSVLLTEWSPSSDSIATSALEVVQSFDPVRMLRTCLNFPPWRLFDLEKNVEDDYGLEGYDPTLVILLIAQMLVSHPPTTAFEWIRVFRSNVVSLLIRCLASRDSNIRQAALAQIARIWEILQTSEMHETHQVIYVLRLLKNTIPQPASPEDPPVRLPTYASLILLHALRAIFYPSNFIYPHTARFLLQRPELDVSDVPMLLGMLYSTSDDWKKERSWILKMLGDGLVSTDDWKVLKRRHTWELLGSLFQSSSDDNAVRTWIFGILANLTCNVQACTSLVLKSSLLSWIEMQVQVGNNVGKEAESLTWLRILENIVLVADTSKLNRATGAEWCMTVCRILSSVLRRQDKSLGILHQCAAVLLWLSLARGVLRRSLKGALSHAVESLLSLEHSINVRHFRPSKHAISAIPRPPHHAQGLQKIPPTDDPLQTWGLVVEGLWRVSMSLDESTPAWTMLTQRLLVWRALAGEEVCPMGEWARREVVRMLGRTSE